MEIKGHSETAGELLITSHRVKDGNFNQISIFLEALKELPLLLILSLGNK